MPDIQKETIEKVQPGRESVESKQQVEKSASFELPKEEDQPKADPAVLRGKPEVIGGEREKVPTPAPGRELPIEKEQREQKLFKEIEEILGDGLEKIFTQMPENLQKEFKESGEKAAHEIVELLSRDKVDGGKIAKIIKEWLEIIPDLKNPYFPRQESTIKTDSVLRLKKDGAGV